jgi:hypothetical protein
MTEKKEIFDGRDIGLSQPAIRALHGAGIRRLEQLAGRREEEIARLHGMGPKGMAALQSAMTLEGLSFAREDRFMR